MLFRVVEVARICAISKSAVYGEIRVGRLRALRTQGGQLRIVRGELSRWLAQNFFCNENRARQRPDLSIAGVRRRMRMGGEQ